MNTAKVLILIILLGLVAIFFLVRQPQNQIELVEVKRGDIKQTVSASGQLVSKETIKIKPETSGEITFLNVEEGDLIEAGQVLLSLENTEQAIVLRQAENTLREKQAILDKILDDIHLFQYGNGGFLNVGSANETQTQRQLRTQAEVTKDNAYDNLRLAQKKFEDSLILSPERALILSVNVSVGQTVSPQDVVLELADLSEVFFEVEVDQSDIVKIKVSQQAEITLDAYPDKIFAGEVAKILPQIKTITSGAEVIIVRVKVDDLQPPFISGLSGQSQIIVSEVKNALKLPVDVLKDEKSVVIQTAKGLEEKEVELGIQSESEVEVKKGLKEGEKVVLNPPSPLSLKGGGLIRLFRR